jgi:hypothetical protein
MSDDPKPNESGTKGWTRAKAWIIGLTGFLVGVPALINAGVDVYKSVLNVPRTDKERVNAELFKKYFKKPPLTVVPVPVKLRTGISEVKFSVYEEGDIYVEYGDLTQWFPFPGPTEAKHAVMSVWSQAFAQNGPDLRGIGEVRQTDRFEGNTLVREREYENGIVERQRIDIRTGAVIEKIVDEHGPQDDSRIRILGKWGTIDADRSPSESPARATTCATPLGSCSLLTAVAAGSACSCVNANGPVNGIAR